MAPSRSSGARRQPRQDRRITSGRRRNPWRSSCCWACRPSSAPCCSCTNRSASLRESRRSSARPRRTAARSNGALTSPADAGRRRTPVDAEASGCCDVSPHPPGARRLLALAEDVVSYSDRAARPSQRRQIFGTGTGRLHRRNRPGRLRQVAIRMGASTASPADLRRWPAHNVVSIGSNRRIRRIFIVLNPDKLPSSTNWESTPRPARLTAPGLDNPAESR